LGCDPFHPAARAHARNPSAWSTKVVSASAVVSASRVWGRWPIVVVTMRACFSEIVPAAWAAAVAAYTGSNASPVIAVRGPNAPATRTRAIASATSTCSSSVSNPAVPRDNNFTAVERHSSSTINR